jgi:hypothetical protein
VQARAAELVFFDQRNGEPKLRSAKCGGVAAASTAEDDYVKGVTHDRSKVASLPL